MSDDQATKDVLATFAAFGLEVKAKIADVLWHNRQATAGELTRLRERNAELEKALIGTLAALAAATSLLSRSSKKAAASDKMFDMMLKDYVKALDAGRDALASSESVVKSEGKKDD